MSAATDSTSRIVWAALAFCLLLLRVPALVQPAGGDQGLYAYTAQRVNEGGVPYRAAWDQKPPGIFFVYALLERVWPYQSIVALADLIVAALVAWLLMRPGTPVRRHDGRRARRVHVSALRASVADAAERRLRARSVRDVHRAVRDDRAGARLVAGAPVRDARARRCVSRRGGLVQVQRARLRVADCGDGRARAGRSFESRPVGYRRCPDRHGRRGRHRGRAALLPGTRRAH